MKPLNEILKLHWKLVEKADNKRIGTQTPTPNIRQITDLPYIADRKRGHLLDIYYPEGTKENLPVIIDIHGGGWMYGYKELNRNYNLKLASKGFLVASISYRLVDEVLFPDQVKDVFAALSWLSQHLSEYPADTDNVFLTGDSAGGHLASVTAAICANKNLQADFDVSAPSFSFNAVGAVSPACDLIDSPVFMQMAKVLIGKDQMNGKYRKYMDFSLIASKNLPPFFILTSSGDFINSQAHILKGVLDRHGVENELHDYVVRLNGKKLQHVFSVTDPYSYPGDRANTEMCDFFKSKIRTAEKA